MKVAALVDAHRPGHGRATEAPKAMTPDRCIGPHPILAGCSPSS